MRFQGKVAIVTGGTRGIGRAIAIRLASEGAIVACCSRQTGADVNKLIADIRAAGGEGFYCQADVTDRHQASDFVKSVEERFGQVDILVNNVGGGPVALFVDVDQATLDAIISANLTAPIFVTQAVLRGMIERQSGKIINISSDSGKVGTSRSVVYSACKGGIIAFTKALARELAQHKINVNSVSPGITDTEGLRTETDWPAVREAIARSIPLHRFAQPEEIAAAVAFLASDEAGYITGQTLSVSGGATMC